MSRHRWVVSSLCALLLLGPRAGTAGTYFRVAKKIRSADPTIPGNIPPYALVHPFGYVDPAGGALSIRVCVRPGSEPLIPAVDWAIARWNGLCPRYTNCSRCRLWEEAPVAGAVSIHSVVLHELGHCAMGLGHPNLEEIAPGEELSAPSAFRTGVCDADNDGDCGSPKSFTASANATDIFTGNAVRGDGDDSQVNGCPWVPAFAVGQTADLSEGPTCSGFEPCASSSSLFDPGVNSNGTSLSPFAAEEPPPRTPSVACPSPPECCPVCPGTQCPVTPLQVHSLFWFRRADDDPIRIDPTALVDIGTMGRTPSALPGGHAFPTNANRAVAEALGYPDTQAVMYSGLQPGMSTWGLTADDVNTIRLARTGNDRTANTADDYTMMLSRVEPTPDCSSAEIEVLFDASLPPGVLGGCLGDITQAFPQGALKIHYRVMPFGSEQRLTIRVNFNTSWDFGPPLLLSGFEIGDTSDWFGCAQ